MRRTAFTLIEMLVVLAIIALLLGLMMPVLSGARRQGSAAACLARLQQLGHAFTMYANDYNDRCMPLAYWTFERVGRGPAVYWWGTNDRGGVDHTRGFVWPYLRSRLKENSVFECPAQPWGSYRPQGAARSVTSTYGYNGYYLSPQHTPGWGSQIGHRPWLNLGRVRSPSQVFAFADTLLDMGGEQPLNNALLDPPRLFTGGGWSDNPSPTTSFRHERGVQVMHVDGHASRYVARPEHLTSESFQIGSVGGDNAPHYVPDWKLWGSP
jgi:prepilin-type N-terminal cleavage/methylation domain-containing protein